MRAPFPFSSSSFPLATPHTLDSSDVMRSKGIVSSSL